MVPTAIVFTQDVTGLTFNLADGVNCITNLIDGVETAPNLVVNTLTVARQDGVKPVSSQYDKRPITLTGTLQDTTVSGYRGRLLNLKTIVATSGTLDVTFPGAGTVRYFVYVTNVGITATSYGTTAGPFTIVMEADDPPFGEDINSTTVTTVSGVIAQVSTTVVVTGSAPANVDIQLFQPPTAIVEFYNVNTGDALQLNGRDNAGSSFYTGSTLELNTGAKSLTLNGANIDYDGNILRFPPGNNPLQINFLPTTGPVQSVTSYNAEQIMSNTVHWGEDFTINSTTTVARIDLLLYKVGAGQSLTFALTNVGTGAVLATATIAASSIPNSPTWVPVTFTGVSLVGSTVYSIKLIGTTAPAFTNYTSWKQYQSGTGLGTGGAFSDYAAAGTGAVAGLDFCHKIWGSLGSTPTVIGSVTQKQRYL
jgi:hypothetical protein